MKNIKLLAILLLSVNLFFVSCKKEDKTPEPAFSKPHEKKKGDYDYFFKDDGGFVKVTKLAGTIVKTVETYNYSYTASTYSSTQFTSSSSLTRSQNGDDIFWSVKINRFDRNSDRPDGDYNDVSISFTLQSKSMPTSTYVLSNNLDDTNLKNDSIVTVSASFQKWVTTTQAHEAKMPSPKQVNLTINSFDPATGLLKGSMNASGKDPDSHTDPLKQKDVNISCEFEVNLVDVLK